MPERAQKILRSSMLKSLLVISVLSLPVPHAHWNYPGDRNNTCNRGRLTYELLKKTELTQYPGTRQHIPAGARDARTAGVLLCLV